MRIQIKGWQLLTGVGLASFGVGTGIGYLLGLRKTKISVDEANLEIEELKSEQLQLDFKRVEMDREFNAQIQQAIIVIRELKESGRVFLGSIKREDPGLDNSIKSHPSNEQRSIIIAPIAHQDNENIMINVFPDENDDWDYDEEVKHRSPDHPYIIHRDEYFSNELDYRQSTLTFYEGDEILCDEQDVPVYNPEKVVGKIIFGHGSQDISICYIRNEHLEAEYEVLVDHGYYQQEVLGAEVGKDIRHSTRVPKFKRE
jgi:hypothetical protein